MNQCFCKASNGQRCPYEAKRSVINLPLCGRHLAALQKNGKVQLYPRGSITKARGELKHRAAQ